MDIWQKLKHQSLGRSLTVQEAGFADALEAIFLTGEHDFSKVCDALNAKGVKPIYANAAIFTLTSLEEELTRLNASLDKAYAEAGLGA